MQDLLDLTHTLTKLRAVPSAKDMKQAMAAEEVKRAAELATKLSMPTLGKTWQILLKGLAEVQTAPAPQSAAEMVVIRLAYAADLPDPADLLKKLKDGNIIAASPAGGGTPSPRGHTPVMSQSSSTAIAMNPDASPAGEQAIHSLSDVVAVLEAAGEYLLASQVFQFVHLVKLQEGFLEIRVQPQAVPRLAQDLGLRLSALCGRRWMVSVSGAGGQATLAEQADAVRTQEYKEVMELPIIQEIFQAFPEAKLTSIKTIDEQKD
jgi:DNA polymerase-3 subunit gamma/tau